jgi:glycosyltransferase involved in cell wall biosynthesis
MNRTIWFDRRFLQLKAGLGRDSKAFLKALKAIDYFDLCLIGRETKHGVINRIGAALIRNIYHYDKRIDHKDLLFFSQVPSRGISSSVQNILLVRIHDLFPITNPEWFSYQQRKEFRKGIENILKNKCFLFFNSLATEKAFRVLYGSSIPGVNLPCSVEYLDKTRCLRCSACNEVFSSDFPSTYALSVGTVEPRKNYAETIDVFEQSFNSFPLVIVGKYGWKSKAILKTLKKTRNVKYLPSCCDGSLIQLYKKASVMVSNSLNEGFNIPIHEFRLYSGNLLLLRDIPVHREFTFSNTYYFKSKSNLATALNNDRLIEKQTIRESPRYFDLEKLHKALFFALTL